MQVCLQLLTAGVILLHFYSTLRAFWLLGKALWRLLSLDLETTPALIIDASLWIGVCVLCVLNEYFLVDNK
jgi:hypothetical protein